MEVSVLVTCCVEPDQGAIQLVFTRQTQGGAGSPVPRAKHADVTVEHAPTSLPTYLSSSLTWVNTASL